MHRCGILDPDRDVKPRLGLFDEDVVDLKLTFIGC